MSAPRPRTSAGSRLFTVPFVLTGMNAGVRTSPCAVRRMPARAAPSVAMTSRTATVDQLRDTVAGRGRRRTARGMASQEEHRVAERVEAVALLDGQHALGGLDPLPRLRANRVALAVQLVLLERLRRERPEGVEADVERHSLDVEPAEQLRREMEPGRWRRGRAGLVGIDRLVPPPVGERLRDVRRQRRLAVRLPVQPDAPASLAEVLDQLDRTVAVARTQLPGRAREREPLVAAEALEQQHFSARTLEPDPRGDDARVVDDCQLAGELLRQVGEPAVGDLAARAAVDEQPGWNSG